MEQDELKLESTGTFPSDCGNCPSPGICSVEGFCQHPGQHLIPVWFWERDDPAFLLRWSQRQADSERDRLTYTERFE